VSKRASSISIRQFLLQRTFIYSALGFLVLILVVNQAYLHTVENHAERVGERVAKQTFNSMYLVMSQGWSRQQLKQFISQMEQENEHSDLRVSLYRGQKVKSLFGDPGLAQLSEYQQSILDSGKPAVLNEETAVRYLYPLTATETCIACHSNATPGDSLGLIEVDQTLTGTLSDARKQLMLTLILMAPLPLLLAWLAVRQISNRVNESIDYLGRNIARVETLSDLPKLEAEVDRFGFAETSRIFRQVTALSNKLNDIAVDKELLEFEIRLLEKFVITSEVVKDWREYVNYLLEDINKVIPVYTMFSIFKVENEVFDLEIFWYRTPTDETRRNTEQAVLRRLHAEGEGMAFGGLNIRHNIVDSQSPERLELNADEVELQSKTLLVETPKIGGIVGIGVHSSTIQDQTKVLVLESILSTLLNVVGSVKAIYKYTKDLEYYATRDPLTNLYNQRMFWELLDYELNRAQRHDYKVAVLLIDLDNFKSINDGYGHSWGDRMLSEFSAQLEDCLDQSAILARYGGDEFVLVLPETDMEQAAETGERVLERIRNFSLPYDDTTRLKLTGSIGVGIYPDHAQNKKDLFMFVDNLMYRAKHSGKDCLSVPGNDELVDIFKDMSDKTQLVTQAIENRQLIPVFQPITRAEGGELKAVEVLSRIQLPDNKLMSANEFIEIAESIDKIQQLDQIVMDKAFATVREAGYEGLIFLNFSPKAVVANDFLGQVRELTERHQINPGKVVFELTERDTVKSIHMLERIILNLKERGFKLAIDDFGSGFSSFHYLKHLPIDFVKIEGEFVANMATDQRDMAFVKSISNLSHELNVETVAEFVESEEVLQLVREAGITYAQGYYIGRPTVDLENLIQQPETEIEMA